MQSNLSSSTQLTREMINKTASTSTNTTNARLTQIEFFLSSRILLDLFSIMNMDVETKFSVLITAQCT